MTATNYLTFVDGVALISDGAKYTVNDHDITITGFGSKIRTPDETVPFGFMTTGNSFLGDVFSDWVIKVSDGFLDFDKAARIFPEVLKELYETNRLVGALGGRHERLSVAFGGWSASRQAFTSDFVSNYAELKRRAFEPTGYQNDIWPAPTIQGVIRLMTNVEIEGNVAAYGISQFAAKILQAQRRQILGFNPRLKKPPVCIVGGFGELVRITRSGTRREVVIRWSDQVGDGQEALRRRVASEPGLALMVAKSRAERRRERRNAREAACRLAEPITKPGGYRQSSRLGGDP